MSWATYVALGDSLTAGRGDPGPGGSGIGWARRLAALLTERTGQPCAFTNLAVDGAVVSQVVRDQLPAACAERHELVSVTVGMNDVRDGAFDRHAFAAEFEELFSALAAADATLLTCTLPDIAALLPLSAALVEPVRERMREASHAIREGAARHGALCVDAWARADVANPALYGTDRLHPNAQGHQLIADAFADLLLPGAQS
jgi:lysophospholipase L1-like esterase